MRSILLIFLSVWVSGMVHCQDLLVEELDLTSFQGSIKSIKENSFAYSIKAGEYKKGKPKRYFKNQDDFYLVFDTVGNRIEKCLYKPTGVLKSRYVYTYNRWGFVTSITSIGATGNVKEKIIVQNKLRDSTYLLERKLIFRNARNNLHFKYVYSSDSTCTETVYYWGNPLGLVTRKFNSSGEVILFYYIEKGHLKYRYEYVYNDLGQLIEEKRFNMSDKLELKYAWNYDTGGRQSSMIVTKKNVVIERWTYRYTFDDKGNWITCTEFESGTAKFLKERQITYY